MILTELNLHSNWDASKTNNFSPSNKGFERVWEGEIMRRLNYAQNLGITQVYFYNAWYGPNQWAAFYSIYPDTGVSTGTGYYVGQWKPIINAFSNSRRQYVMFGTQEGQGE